MINILLQAIKPKKMSKAHIFSPSGDFWGRRRKRPFISIIFVFPIMTRFKTEMLQLIPQLTKLVSFVQRPGLLSMSSVSGLAAKFRRTQLNTF